MSKLIFLAPFPTEEISKDGMVQRVKYIDEQFKCVDRIYLNLSFKNHFRPVSIRHSDLLIEYKFNGLLHFFKIWFLIRKTDYIYIHSLYRFIHPCLQLLFFAKKQICLDVHGVVPEENRLTKGVGWYMFYQFFEWIAFRIISKVIYVTDAMRDHYSIKYKSRRIKSIIYNIYPNICFSPQNESDIQDSSKIIVIYSGNAQKWQNIELMLDLIHANQQSEQFQFIILTGDIELIRKRIKEKNIDERSLSLLSVLPQDLAVYYRKAHYGFILRDDNVVNRVANPTKMIEYLLFGIVPIVKLKEIGDFSKLNYEYVDYKDFNSNLKPCKSDRNRILAKQVQSLNYSKDLYSFIFH